MAYKMGDDTAALEGRMTLNPAAHMDPIGTVVMPLLMIFFNAPAIGWARPVPTNPTRFKDYRKGQILVAAAGPGSNIILALLFLLLYGLYGLLPLPAPILALDFFFSYMVIINLALAAFNLIPLPPLDGSWIAAWGLPRKYGALYDRYVAPYGTLILLGLFMTGLLYYLLSPAYYVAFKLLDLVPGSPG
jgi:Zn-dependent protease